MDRQSSKPRRTYKDLNPDLRTPKMSHIRQVKPEFFVHRVITGLKPATRLAFVGLWTCADKNGRFEWWPESLKLRILPFDPVDFCEVLGELLAAGFIGKYSVGGEDYGFVLNFNRHQTINKRERESTFSYPEPPQEALHRARTVHAQCLHRGQGQGQGQGQWEWV